MGGNSEVAVFFNENVRCGGGGGLCAGRVRAARNSLEAAWDKGGMRYGLKISSEHGREKWPEDVPAVIFSHLFRGFSERMMLRHKRS